MMAGPDPKLQWEFGIKPDNRKSGFLIPFRWFELGGILSLGALTMTFISLKKDGFSVEALLWFNLFSLFLHQFEEYGYPGWFPGLINRKVFGSPEPLSYPLNSFSAMVVNVIFGWGLFGAAALWGGTYPELALPALLVSAGNVVSHIFFSLKARRFYNPGLFTALLFFAPLCMAYLQFADPMVQLNPRVFYNGLLLGIMANALIPFLILLMARQGGQHAFGYRHDVPEARGLL